MTDRQIDWRIGNGSLIRVHRGVFRLGHLAPSHLADYLAAVKACGPGAALGGLAAAHLHGLIRRRPKVIEVLTPNDRRVPGIRARRVRGRRIPRTLVEGIPVATIARTLIDAAPLLDDEALAWACHRAFTKRCRPAAIVALLAEMPAARGRRRLLRVLLGDDPLLLSELEREFISMLRAGGVRLPPIVNREVGIGVVDMRWPDLHLTIELDSYRFHGSRKAWERDRRRDADARRRGDELIRYTWGDVFERREETLAECVARIGLA